MSEWKSLLDRIFSRDQRKAQRKPAPKLAAYFWTGGAPAPSSVRDISLTGMYLLTSERWYPGTLLMLTLQTGEPAIKRTIAVQAKAVRWGADGVGVEFILPDRGDPRRGQELLDDGTDRKSLEKFLKKFEEESGSAVVDSVWPESGQGTGSNR